MTNTAPQTIDTLRALILADQNLTARLATMDDRNSLIAAIGDYATSHNMAISADEIAAAPELVAQGDELSDEMLENVAAGAVPKSVATPDAKRFGGGGAVSMGVRGP